MNIPGYDATGRERQIGLSLLAHAARGDTLSLAASLDAIADCPDAVDPLHVIGALLVEFRKGMVIADYDEETLARSFAADAQALAFEDRG
jgi:hypothetical protein